MQTQMDSVKELHQNDLIDHAFCYESEVRSYCRSFKARFESASGARMFDSRGKMYIDFLAGCGALNYGHNDPDMTTAVVDYVRSNGVIHGLDMHTRAKARFIEAFVNSIQSPRELDYKIQFTGPTGTNAVEAAMKLARKVTGRTEIIAFTNGFHGVSMGALAATGNRHHRMGPEVPLIGVSRAMYEGYLGSEIDTADSLNRLLDDPSSGYDKPAAILLETVQGEGGLNTASREWLSKIAAIARKNDALLIVDDIQAGCGRTGSFLSFDHLGIQPDIVTLSKSLSGYGLPMAMVLIKSEFDKWLPGEHNGTFRGNNLAFVTARVALEKFWQSNSFEKELSKKAAILTNGLKGIADFIPGSVVRGRGMMQGIWVGSGDLAAAICQRCFEHGLIVERSGAHDDVVKILAPLTISENLLHDGLSILRRCTELALSESDQILVVPARVS